MYIRKKPVHHKIIQKRPSPLTLPSSINSPANIVVRPSISTRTQGHRKSACDSHFPIEIQGELRKRNEKTFAGRFPWRKRWFVVQNGYLKYFATESDAAHSTVPLKAIDLRQIKDLQSTAKGFCFRVMRLGSTDRVLLLKTHEKERHRISEWIAALSPSSPAPATTIPLDTYDPSREYIFLKPEEVRDLANFHNDGSWTALFSQEQGKNDCVTSFKKAVNAEGLMQYLSFGEFPFPAATVFKVMQGDFEYLKVWEKNTLDVSVLDQRALPGGDIQSLIHWIVKWPTFFKNREYLYCRRTRTFTEADGTQVFAVECAVPVCFKTEDASKLPTSYHPTDAMRVLTYEAMTVLMSTGPSSCKFVFKCIDDPRVVLPKSLMTWVVDQALPTYMKTMRKAIREYDSFANHRQKPIS